jgi:hypothetical protein
VKLNPILRSFELSLVTVVVGVASLSYAQETVANNKVVDLSVISAPSASSPTPSPDPSPTRDPAASDDSGWHLAISPYLWLAGAHGTLGAFDRQISFKASVGDLLSNFRFGLMGIIDTRHDRLVTPVDIIWIRLADSKALPFPNIQATSADVKVDEFILTPKIGYRMLDAERFKIDGLVGFRYWHMGQNLSFSPSRLGLNLSTSQNWVDPLVGARFIGMLSPKLEATIGGDVGGGGVQSQLDYQVGGALGYKLKPRWTLQAGYRYLFFDYRPNHTSLDLAMSGAFFGVTFKLK